MNTKNNWWHSSRRVSVVVDNDVVAGGEAQRTTGVDRIVHRDVGRRTERIDGREASGCTVEGDPVVIAIGVIERDRAGERKDIDKAGPCHRHVMDDQPV